MSDLYECGQKRRDVAANDWEIRCSAWCIGTALDDSIIAFSYALSGEKPCFLGVDLAAGPDQSVITKFPFPRHSSRRSDCNPNVKLRVHVNEQDDALVMIETIGRAPTSDPVEFCMSGTMSPRTREAIKALFFAMEQDEKEYVQ